MKKWLLLLLVMFGWVKGANAIDLLTCYNTNGVNVCHNRDDQSIFYQPPITEHGYNIQTIQDGNKFYTIYHSEPKTGLGSGDSIKAGSQVAPYSFGMPTNRKFILWGNTNDPLSILYAPVVSGGANPMVVSGRRDQGDNYFYIFFLGVKDFVHGGNGGKHYLLKARTLNFSTIEIWADVNGIEQWKPFNDQACSQHKELCRPSILKDIQGNFIESNHYELTATQGLIGSISYVNGMYYYFYSDFDPNDDKNFYLYYRKVGNVSNDAWKWSAPVKLTSRLGSVGQLVRVGKMANEDKWVVLYNCAKANGGQDLCIEVTKNLDVGEFEQLNLGRNGAKNNLNIKGSGTDFESLSQPYQMTDIYGNLTNSPDGTTDKLRVEIYWSDQKQLFGGTIYRAGVSLTVIPVATNTPVPTNTPTPIPICIPNCTNKACGNDGCGSSCGSCDVNESCINYQCIVPTPTPTPVPGCLCNTDDSCAAVCVFDKFSDVTYNNMNTIKCSLSASLFAATPSIDNKRSWCLATKRTKGDADGNGVVNMDDYYYYVSAANGGKIPTWVNPDFNGDGEVNLADRTIVVRSLKL